MSGFVPVCPSFISNPDIAIPYPDPVHGTQIADGPAERLVGALLCPGHR
jgi:hypothetical protein